MLHWCLFALLHSCLFCSSAYSEYETYLEQMEQEYISKEFTACPIVDKKLFKLDIRPLEPGAWGFPAVI